MTPSTARFLTLVLALAACSQSPRLLLPRPATLTYCFNLSAGAWVWPYEGHPPLLPRGLNLGTSPVRPYPPELGTIVPDTGAMAVTWQLLAPDSLIVAFQPREVSVLFAGIRLHARLEEDSLKGRAVYFTDMIPSPQAWAVVTGVRVRCPAGA